MIASTYDSWKTESPLGLYIIYCLLLFSLSGGPNVTTFIFPSELFPISIRTTFNGMAAACGKIGAVVGVFLFGPLVAQTSYTFVMLLCAVFAFIGAIISYFLIVDDSHCEGTVNQAIVMNITTNRELGVSEKSHHVSCDLSSTNRSPLTEALQPELSESISSKFSASATVCEPRTSDDRSLET